MTPDQVKLVQDSFAKVEPDRHPGRRYVLRPACSKSRPRCARCSRPTFPLSAISCCSMLPTAVTNLHQVEVIIPAVQDLGKRHVGYGVKDAHYDKVGEALIWTLEKGLGDDSPRRSRRPGWTPT